MDAAQYRARQDAAVRPLVQFVRQLLRTLGVPVTEQQRWEMARVLMPKLQLARRQSYALAVHQMRQQASAAGVEPPTPAPLRDYRPQAVMAVLERVAEARVTTTAPVPNEPDSASAPDEDAAPDSPASEPAARRRSSVTVASPTSPSPRPRIRVTVDELDEGSQQLARRTLRAPVAEDNRRDPQVVDVVARRTARALARHAEMAGRHAIIDTVDRGEPSRLVEPDDPQMQRPTPSVTVDEPTRTGSSVTVTPSTRVRPTARIEDRQSPTGRTGGRSRPRERRVVPPRSGPELGWARVLTGRESCGFCAMLASRGPVYRSRATASSTAAGDAYHDGCDCVPMPVYRGRDWEGRREYERLEDLWATSTVGNSGADARRAFTRAFLEAREENPDRFVPESMRGDQAPDPSVEVPEPDAPDPAAGGGGGGNEPPPGPPAAGESAGDMPDRWPPIPDLDIPQYTQLGGDGIARSRNFVDEDGVGEPLPDLEHMPGHVLHGWRDDDQEPHQLSARAGHRWDSERANATTFPQSWSDQQIVDAIRETVESPNHEKPPKGSRRVVRKEVDGVVIEAMWSMVNGRAQGLTAYPVGGDGVFTMVPVGRKAR